MRREIRNQTDRMDVVVMLGLAVLAFLVPAANAQQNTASGQDDIPRTGLVLWYSAGDVKVDKDAKTGKPVIIQINDKSGKDNNAMHNTGPQDDMINPTVVAGAAGGQPVLRFGPKQCSFGFNRVSDIRTVVWVVSKNPESFKQQIERFVLGDTESLDFHPGTHFTDTILHQNDKYGAKALHAGKAWLNGAPIDAQKTDFPKQLSVITLVATDNVKANQISKDRNMGNRCWIGDIAEILVYNVPLSDSDRQKVENSMINKYKIDTTVKPVISDGPPAAKEGEKSKAKK